MIGQTPIRFVLSDLDGTLIDSRGVLTEAVLDAVKDLRRAGIAFAVVTGRPPQGVRALADELDLTLPVACFNGGMLIDASSLESCQRFKIIERHIIAPETAVQVIATLDQLGVDAWIYREVDEDVKWVIRDIDSTYAQREERRLKFKPQVVASFNQGNQGGTQGIFDGVVKIVGVSGDPALIERAERQLRESWDGKLTADRSQPYYLDITHPRANKGSVARWYARRLGISLAEVLTLGDMPSDTRMFRVSGFSVAMGNATPEVQQQARDVTASHDQDGFAKAIRNLIFRKNSQREAS